MQLCLAESYSIPLENRVVPLFKKHKNLRLGEFTSEISLIAVCYLYVIL